MKRIIDMLLKMIWPAFASFVLLLIELFVLEESVCIIRRSGDESSVSTIVVPVDEWRMGLREGLKGFTVFLVVLFSTMFIVGFIWNIVYSIKHKDEE